MNLHLPFAMMSAIAAEKAQLVGLQADFFTTIINMVILFLVLRKLLFKPVTEFMNKRSEGIENSLKEAELKNQEADQLIAKYESKLQSAEQEGTEIIKQKRRLAEEKASEILKAADEEAKKIKEKASLEIEREKVKAINDMKNEISSLALLAASKVIEKDLDESTHGDLINKFINEVGDAKWQN